MKIRLSGFTLIETLIALFLGALLMAGLATVYLAVKKSNRKQMVLLNLTDQQRFTEYILTTNLRNAGNANCIKQGLIDQKNALHGYDGGNLPNFLNGKAMNNSDAMLIGECVRYHDQHKFIRMAYFVGDTHRKDTLGHPILALYRMPLGGVREELVVNVNQFSIRYGVVTKDRENIAQYLPASAVQSWENVRSVWLILSPLSLYVFLRERVDH